MTDDTLMTVNEAFIGNYGDLAVSRIGVAPFRTVSNVPTTFRIARYPDGRLIVQGGYHYQEGFKSGFEWHDLPMVDVDEDGNETDL